MNELTLALMVHYDRLASANHQAWLTNQWISGLKITGEVKEDIIDVQNYDWDSKDSIY